MKLAEKVTTIIQSDKRRVIVGAGVTGLSCARYFSSRGQQFALIDSRPAVDAVNELHSIAPNAVVVTGAWDEELLQLADELYVSPGVALNEPALQRAFANGAELKSDIDLFVQEAKAPLIAITGSNAKSTVTTMVGNMLTDAGMNVGVGGNLGRPALDLLDDDCDAYVLELSSFQLERCGSLRAKVACVLNLSEDHLDRHATMAEYHRLKQRIYQGASMMVCNRDDPLTTPLAAVGSTVVSFGASSPDLKDFGLRQQDGGTYLAKGRNSIMPVSALPLVGEHNALNALAALAIVDAMGIDLQLAATSLQRFTALKHRCELVANVDGVAFIDDSKATNVGATVAALKGLATADEKRIVLIAGGDSKAADFTPFAKAASQYCRHVICIGRDAALIETALSGQCPVELCDDLPAAVTMAAALAQRGDTVLLSPACASLDMFDNYEHRGRVFVESVLGLRAKRGER